MCGPSTDTACAVSQALFAKYSDGEGMINYRLFCENCTHSLHDLEQTPQLIDTKADMFITEVHLPPLEESYSVYRGTSIIRNCAPLGPYSRNMPRGLWRP